MNASENRQFPGPDCVHLGCSGLGANPRFLW
jgi:hypothetical protein